MDSSEVATGRRVPASRAGTRDAPAGHGPAGAPAPAGVPMASMRRLIDGPGQPAALATPAVQATVLAGGNAAAGRLISRATPPATDELVSRPASDELVSRPAAGDELVSYPEDRPAAAPGSESTLEKIRDLAYQAWVGPLAEAEIESLWASFGAQLPAVAGAEMPLWRHCLDVGAELDDLPQIVRLREQFAADIRQVTAGYLAGNRQLIAEEMQRFGLPAAPSVPVPAADAAQAAQLREMQVAAAAVAGLQAAQERARRVYVGYEIMHTPPLDGAPPMPIWTPVPFDPYAPPQLDTAPDSGLLSRVLMPGMRVPIVPYQQIKQRYDEASDAITGLVTRFPALYGLSREGASTVTAGWAAAGPEQARAQLAAALRAVEQDIVNATAKLGNGELDPLDLQPVQEQLFAGRRGGSGVGWGEPLPGWAAREQLADHSFQRALTTLGLQTAATALFLVAPFTGGASLLLMLGGLAVTGAQFHLSQERYEALRDASGTAVGADTELVSRPEVDAAELARNADAVALALAALTVGVAAAAKVPGALRGRAAVADDAAAAAKPEPYDFTKTDALRDPVAHAHVNKLRQMALDQLAPAGADQPVKVVPLRYTPASAVKGDFTQAKFVAGRTPEEIARVLGVTEFKDGVRIYRLDRSAITVENLNLRGYTQSPAGKSPQLQTPENLAKWPPGLGAPQWNTKADIPVMTAAEIRPGEIAKF